MKGVSISFGLFLFVDVPRQASSFGDRRTTNSRFPSMKRWVRPFGSNRYSRPFDENDGATKPTASGRRDLLLGSAAALGSAIWGRADTARASTVILEESEARRIEIFERNAPSVVFIDTFTEKQDQFSPNVMEVPLGSGSGFLWDKEGHIGK